MDKSADVQWYVLYTKSRHEKFVEDKLIRKGIAAFTPKVTLRRKWSDRIKYIEQPLFASYCFAKFSLIDKVKVISQAGVAGIVRFKDKYIPVEDTVIESLKTLTANKVVFNPYEYLKTGDKIVVAQGPLKGVEGYIVEKRKDSTSLVISVDAIHSSVKFVVDTCFIEAD
jgi:transcription antitermination factor NusG